MFSLSPSPSSSFFISSITITRRTLTRLGWLAPVALAPWMASAQTRLPDVTVTANDAPRLHRPLSTGSNLDLSALQTAASVEVVGREQLQARGDTSLMDAITRTTGISSMAHPGNSGSALSARGFTDSTSVMRLYDGTRQYGNVSVSFPFDTWAVERIEVLRGPASVIYGDGGIGGVINIVPKKPTRGPIRSEAQATVGTDGKRGLAYGSGGALSEHLSYRFDISGERSDSWIDYSDTRNHTFSGALQFDASPDLQFKLSHAQGKQHPIRYTGMPSINGEHPEALRKVNYNVQDSRIKYHDRWTELAAQWTPDSTTLVRSALYHIQSDRYWRNAEAFSYNSTTGLIDRSDNTEIAHDQSQVGLTTHAAFSTKLLGLANRFSVGFDINSSKFKHTNNTYTGTSPSTDLYNTMPGLYSSEIAFIPRYRNSAEQHAVFTENRLELNEQLSLVGGLRYDSVRIKRNNLVKGTQDFNTTYSNVGVRLGAVYMVQPDTSLYAQYARAADPARAMMFLNTSSSVFDFTKGRQFEVGIKQSILDKKGDWSLALYHIAKSNLLTRSSTSPSQWIQVGEQSSQGIEGTLSLPITHHVQFDGNIAVLKARYDDFTESVNGVAVSRNGKVPSDVPERVANAWLGYKALPNLTLSAGVRYVGARYADDANTLRLPSYTTLDLAAQWRITPDTTLSVRGFNVSDKYYFTTAYYNATQWLVGEGRRFELSLHHKF